MATTVLQGTLGVEDTLSSKEVRDVSKELNYRYKDISPIFMIFNMLPYGRVAKNYKVEWFQKEDLPRQHYLTTTVAGGATATLLPAQTAGGSVDTTPFKVGDVVRVPNSTVSSTVSNIGVVTTVNAGTSIVVTPIGWQSDGSPGDSAKTFAATTSGDQIFIVSDASEEASNSPTAKTTKDVAAWNYVQFLRAPYVVGNINMDTEKYTGPERAERKDETYRDIRIQAENVMVWGDRYYRDGTSGRQFFCRGFYEHIRNAAGDNILDNWTASLTESKLDEYLVTGPGMHGSDRKFWFMSNDLFLKTTEIIKSKVDRIEKVTKFGLQFLSYLAPDGKEYLIRRHHQFKGDDAGFGLIIDPAYARIRPYGRQGTIRIMKDIQDNDFAGIKDEWQVILSLEVMRSEPHGYQKA